MKVEQKSCLGIYLSQNHATAVLVSAQNAGYTVSNCFSLSAQTDEGQNPQLLSRSIAEACAKQQLTFNDVAVALDCEMFTQHNLHSEFTNPKQIAQTVKFDAEEAFAADASELAVTFNITEVSDSGSQLNVFAAGKKLLADILANLQNNGLDPITIEPDVTALARFTSAVIDLEPDLNPLFAILSQHACYLITPAAARENFTVRTFLTTKSQNKNNLLTGQIPLTIASAHYDKPINCLRLLDATDSVNCDRLTEKLGIQTEPVDLAQATNTEPTLLADCDDSAAFAVAFGAAVGQLTKAARPDFRADFAPYQGGKVLLEKTLRILSISATVLMLTIGLYFQLRLMKTNEYRAGLQQKLQEQYAVVMQGEQMDDNFVRKLTSARGRLKDGTSAIRAGEESVSELLTFTLEALNNAPPTIDLQVNSISVSPKTVVIDGSTQSRQHTKLFSTVDRHSRLKKDHSTYNPKKGRANFRLTIVPETPTKK